jgi:hypothetical protein
MKFAPAPFRPRLRTTVALIDVATTLTIQALSQIADVETLAAPPAVTLHSHPQMPKQLSPVRTFAAVHKFPLTSTPRPICSRALRSAGQFGTTPANPPEALARHRTPNRSTETNTACQSATNVQC